MIDLTAMPTASPKTVDEYIARQPAEVQAVLRRVRQGIRKAMPAAEEVISYQMPAYRLHGRVVLFFAAWKQHYAIYPSTDRLVAAFADELSPYRISKGTIRFPYSEPVPAALIERLARFRAEEAADWKAAPKKATKRR